MLKSYPVCGVSRERIMPSWKLGEVDSFQVCTDVERAAGFYVVLRSLWLWYLISCWRLLYAGIYVFLAAASGNWHWLANSLWYHTSYHIIIMHAMEIMQTSCMIFQVQWAQIHILCIFSKSNPASRGGILFLLILGWHDILTFFPSLNLRMHHN